MAIRFDCPNCKANYEVADDLGGKIIMCRVCKKRGPVRSLAAVASSAALPTLAVSTTPVSRRNFLPLVGLFFASLGAIGVGALLARQPWDRGKESQDDFSGKGRRFRQQQDGDKKDAKQVVN